jgi:hypothetical protein
VSSGTLLLEHHNLFHTGIVVDDLAAAKAEYGDALGITWYEGGAKVQLLTANGTRTVQTAYALSREGPHHIELVRSIEDTLWTATKPGHAHHLGYWVDDLAGACAGFEECGATRLAAVTMREDKPPICAYYLTSNGLCVEIVDHALRPVLLPDAEVPA